MKVKSRRGRHGKLRGARAQASKHARAPTSEHNGPSDGAFQAMRTAVAQLKGVESLHEVTTRGATERLDFTTATLTETPHANQCMENASRTTRTNPNGVLLRANLTQANLQSFSTLWTGHTVREAPQQNLERAIESLTLDLDNMRRRTAELTQAIVARHMQPFQYGKHANSQRRSAQPANFAETPYNEALQAKLAKIEVEFFSVRNELAETQARLAQKVQKIAQLEDRLDTLMRERAKHQHSVEYESSLFDVAATQLKISSEKGELLEQIETLRRTVDEMRCRAETAEQAADVARRENDAIINELRYKIDDMAQAHALQLDKNTELDKQIVTQRKELSRLQEALHHAERKLTAGALALAVEQQNAAIQGERGMALKRGRFWKWSAPVRVVVSLLAQFEGALARRRNPNPLFDAHYYLEKYPDVRSVGIDAYAHFRRYGAAERRDPNPMFDTSWYCERYPDVTESGLNPLDHYYLVGAKEGRDPHPLFSTSWYKQMHPDVSLDNGDLLLHFLNSNWTGGECVPIGAEIG